MLRSGLVEAVVGQAGDVEIAAAGAFPVFGEDGGGFGVREKAARAPSWPRRPQPVGGSPLAMRQSGGLHRGPEWRRGRGRCAVRVGHRTVSFAPGGCRQQEIGVGRRLSAHGLLEDDEFGGVEGSPHFALVGKRMGGIGAGDPRP